MSSTVTISHDGHDPRRRHRRGARQRPRRAVRRRHSPRWPRAAHRSTRWPRRTPRSTGSRPASAHSPTGTSRSTSRVQLQRSLIRSHAAGMGPAVEREVVRALMLLRLKTLASGRTGARPVVAETMAALLNAGHHPGRPRVRLARLQRRPGAALALRPRAHGRGTRGRSRRRRATGSRTARRRRASSPSSCARRRAWPSSTAPTACSACSSWRSPTSSTCATSPT